MHKLARSFAHKKKGRLSLFFAHIRLEFQTLTFVV